MLLGGGNSAIEIVGPGNDAVTRIILDQILQGRRQLGIVFDNQDLEHLPPPQGPEKIQPLEGDAA
jgi:hypothetical protein